MMPTRRERGAVLKLSDVPEMETAVCITLDVPVSIDVDGEGEGGVALPHNVLDGTARRRGYSEM